ncbi:hypothetical protein [Neisseria sp. S1]|uniref:hypothetical protein n=1 Tax=Neisseria sp. S1 TaxID=3318354 RepID=UPI003A852A6D
MIKVVYTYRTKTEDLNELMEKFARSALPQFDSQPNNLKIEMSRRDEGRDTYIRLDIYYNCIEDYQVRNRQERSWPQWQEIWFNPDNKHTEVSVEVYEVLHTG